MVKDELTLTKEHQVRLQKIHMKLSLSSLFLLTTFLKWPAIAILRDKYLYYASKIQSNTNDQISNLAKFPNQKQLLKSNLLNINCKTGLSVTENWV